MPSRIRAFVGILAVTAVVAGTAAVTSAVSAASPPEPSATGPATSARHAPTLGPAAARRAGYADNDARFLAMRRRWVRGRAAPADDPKHVVWAINPKTLVAGGGATQTVSPTLDVTAASDDTVYAPTLYPSGDSCVEVTTVYRGDQRAVEAWDWCAAEGDLGFKAILPIDEDFLATYTTDTADGPAYRVRIERTDADANGWTATVFNVSTGQWDVLYTSEGVSKTYPSGGTPGTGWDMFEVYTHTDPATGNGFYCAQSAGDTFSSTNIEWRLDQTWTPASPDNSTVNTLPSPGEDFLCPSLVFTPSSAVDAWQVRNTAAP